MQKDVVELIKDRRSPLIDSVQAYATDCEQNNGKTEYKSSRDGSHAHIHSFEVDTSVPHAPASLLYQTMQDMKSINVKRCSIGLSIQPAFHNMLAAFGFVKHPKSNTFYHNDIENISSSVLEDYLYPQQGGKITFDIPCHFINELAQEDEERDPFIDVYLSQSASSQVTRIPVGGAGMGSLTCEFDTKSGTIEPDVDVNVDCFAHLRNKHGEFCVNQAGSVTLPLSRLLSLSRNSSSDIERTLTLRFRIPASPSDEKGQLLLNVTPGSVRMHNVRIEQRRIMHTSHPVYTDSEKVTQLKKEYVKSCYRTFKMRPTWKAIEGIHAYEYVSRAGIFPALMFHVFETPRSSEEYWLNALDVCLRREGRMTLEEFRHDDDPQHAAKMMVSCCTLYVNYCKYITDKVDRNKRNGSKKYDRRLVKIIESFDLVRPRNAGDCEDFGKEEMIEAFELEDFQRVMHRAIRNASAMHTAEDPALVRLGKARHKYYAFAALGGVSSMTINGDYDEIEHMGAHEWLMLIPKHYFYEMLVRTYGETSGNKLVRERDRHIGKDVTVMVGEGTGMLQPDGKGENADPKLLNEFESYSESDIREDPRAPFQGLRKMFHYDYAKGSSFYQTITSLFTNEFIHAGIARVGEFVMAYRNPRSNNFTYGVRFAEVTSKSSHPCLIAQPEVPSALFEYMMREQENEHPIMPLQPPTNRSYKPIPGTNAYNLQYKPLLNPDRVDKTPVKFTYYARYDQLSELRVELLLKRAKQFNATVQVDREPVSGKYIGGYKITFIIPRDSFNSNKYIS